MPIGAACGAVRKQVPGEDGVAVETDIGALAIDNDLNLRLRDKEGDVDRFSFVGTFTLQKDGGRNIVETVADIGNNFGLFGSKEIVFQIFPPNPAFSKSIV